MPADLSIGEVAERSGVPATTLRYYDEVGLLTPVERQGGRRRYAPGAVDRLAVIGLCKSAGFSLEEIQLLFDDAEPGRPASRALGAAKLAEIDDQIDRLRAARSVIEWGLTCACPTIDTCTCGIHPH